MGKPEFNATLSERIDITPDLALFRVKPKGWAIPEFKAGQFVVLGLPGSAPRCAGSLPDEKPLDPEKFIQRAYSIASTPLLKDYLEFYITVVKQGIFTPRLFSLKAGDDVFLGQKFTGAFTMTEVPEEAHLVYVATGTGIAPFKSMLDTYLKSGDRHFSLVHGVRESADLGYRQEMLELEKKFPNFSYHPILSRPEKETTPWAGPTGHVQHVWESGELQKKWNFKPTPANTHIFLCGSPAMIESMIEVLGKDGFKEHKKTEPGQIHVERYW